MKFAEFTLRKGERLICDDCNTIIKGILGKTMVYLQEATRSDPPAVGKVLCVNCMEKLKKDTDIKVIIVNES